MYRHYMNNISTHLKPHEMIISTFILLSSNLAAGAHNQNWTIAQIPQWIRQLSDNVTFCNRNMHRADKDIILKVIACL